MCEKMKTVQTKTGTIERQCFHDPAHPFNLESLREAIAEGGFYEAIGLFSIVYDEFGEEFETFVLNDQARRDRGEPTKPEAEMAAWCLMLAKAAEHYAEALLSENH
jgi:hypothetical protein